MPSINDLTPFIRHLYEITVNCSSFSWILSYMHLLTIIGMCLLPKMAYENLDVITYFGNKLIAWFLVGMSSMKI